MSHLNYNHLYYFWMTQKKGSVTAAAEALRDGSLVAAVLPEGVR